VATIAELRQFAATPLGRYEARSSWHRARLATYATAVILNLLAAGACILVLWPQTPDDSPPSHASIAMLAASMILAVLVLTPMISSIGLSASAITGERESGTLEALLLAPLDRRTLLWAKLLGRTAAPRRFMLTTVPAYLCSSAVVVIYLGLSFGSARHGDRGGWFWLGTILCVLLAALAVALIWGIIFYQMHAVAAVGLWFSSKYRRSWTATLLTYLAVLGPTVVLVGFGGILSLVWPMVLGPALFSELVALFDERALGPDGLQ
jgi:ABC-type Na+ efflux pump permease subunit